MNSDCSTNALSNLSKYAQTDNTLRNEASRRQIDKAQVRFKNNLAIDHNLNQEFNAFSGSGNNAFANNFMEHIQQQKFQANQQAQMENGWVQNFSQLSMNQNPVQKEYQPQQHYQQQNAEASAWNQQFMQQNNHQQSMNNSNQQRFQFTPTYSSDFRMMNGNIGSLYGQDSTQASTLTEHKEMHKLEEEQKIFDNHFDMIERELNEQPIQEESTHADIDKDQFAKTAKQVKDTMVNSNTSAETNSKFQNSNFLKLMTAIGNRNVELEGDKLVNASNGEDIRQYLSDPLKDLKTTGETNKTADMPIPSASQTENNSINIRPNISHLPDPLAHLKDGDLANISEPLQAARIVSGNQVQPREWMESFETLDRPLPRRSILTPELQEQYDDYRNDDH